MPITPIKPQPKEWVHWQKCVELSIDLFKYRPAPWENVTEQVMSLATELYHSMPPDKKIEVNIRNLIEKMEVSSPPDFIKMKEEVLAALSEAINSATKE